MHTSHYGRSSGNYSYANKYIILEDGGHVHIQRQARQPVLLDCHVGCDHETFINILIRKNRVSEPNEVCIAKYLFI